MSVQKNVCLSSFQCLPDPLLSERAEGEFRGMAAMESTATCDRVVIFRPCKVFFVTNFLIMQAN